MTELLAAEQFIVGTALVSLVASVSSLVYAEMCRFTASGILRRNKLVSAVGRGLVVCVSVELSAKVYFLASFLMIAPYRDSLPSEESLLPASLQIVSLIEYPVFFVAMNMAAMLLVFFSWTLSLMHSQGGDDSGHAQRSSDGGA